MPTLLTTRCESLAAGHVSVLVSCSALWRHTLSGSTGLFSRVWSLRPARGYLGRCVASLREASRPDSFFVHACRVSCCVVRCRGMEPSCSDWVVLAPAAPHHGSCFGGGRVYLRSCLRALVMECVATAVSALQWWSCCVKDSGYARSVAGPYGGTFWAVLDWQRCFDAERCH